MGNNLARQLIADHLVEGEMRPPRLVLETLSFKTLPIGSSPSARQKSLLAHVDVLI